MGVCTMGSRRLLLVVMVLAMSQLGSAQSPTYGVGRAPTAEEIRAWDITISPTGKELPPGHGAAKEGAQIYVQKGCAGCHGPAQATAPRASAGLLQPHSPLCGRAGSVCDRPLLGSRAGGAWA